MLWSGPLRLSHGITHANACTHSLSRFSDRAIRGTKGFTMTVKLGVNLWSQASDWPSFLAAGRRAEELGFDSLWTWDHLYAIFGDPHQPILEGYAALAALAQVTDRIRGADAVVHLAAIPAPELRPPGETFRINTMSTYNVFEAPSTRACVGRSGRRVTPCS